MLLIKTYSSYFRCTVLYGCYLFPQLEKLRLKNVAGVAPPVRKSHLILSGEPWGCTAFMTTHDSGCWTSQENFKIASDRPRSTEVFTLLHFYTLGPTFIFPYLTAEFVLMPQCLKTDGMMGKGLWMWINNRSCLNIFDVILKNMPTFSKTMEEVHWIENITGGLFLL